VKNHATGLWTARASVATLRQMPLPVERRVLQLRLLARQLELAPASFLRDELLLRTRRRLVEIEARDELDPPSPIPDRPVRGTMRW